MEHKVGPVPHSTVHAGKLMETMEVTGVRAARGLTRLFNKRMAELGQTTDIPVKDINLSDLGKVPIFVGAGKVDYPR
eukprot:761941-Hanusia_phi.AAC.2